MILVALMIGILLVVAAIRNSQASLFSALATDVPQFVVWAAAILALWDDWFHPRLEAYLARIACSCRYRHRPTRLCRDHQRLSGGGKSRSRNGRDRKDSFN